MIFSESQLSTYLPAIPTRAASCCISTLQRRWWRHCSPSADDTLARARCAMLVSRTSAVEAEMMCMTTSLLATFIAFICTVDSLAAIDSSEQVTNLLIHFERYYLSQRSLACTVCTTFRTTCWHLRGRTATSVWLRTNAVLRVQHVGWSETVQFIDGWLNVDKWTLS
jgi:hypothetical protein